jgi:F0F1-type ATP synthase membrane subunit b/b'
MEKDAKVQSAEIIAKAKAESQQYWEEVSAKIDAYCEQHIGVRELLSIINSEKIQIKKS